jgi:hypothetical protein
MCRGWTAAMRFLFNASVTVSRTSSPKYLTGYFFRGEMEYLSDPMRRRVV